MPSGEKTPFERLIMLSQELKLNYDEADFQDWGYIYADGSRLEEFIGFFQRRCDDLVPMQKFHLFELILASANEAILENKLHTPDKFINFVKQYGGEFREMLSFWIKNRQDEEFPVAKLLSQIQHDN